MLRERGRDVLRAERALRAVPRELPHERLGVHREDAGAGTGRGLQRAEVGPVHPFRDLLRDSGLGLPEPPGLVVLPVPAGGLRAGARPGAGVDELSSTTPLAEPQPACSP